MGVGRWRVGEVEGTGEDSVVGGVNREGGNGERLERVGVVYLGDKEDGGKEQRGRIGGWANQRRL